ncbi:MAG: ArsR family transcriptional regulator [Archaeoglobales archaeon]|nr:MAG: ArsR family transcriptional regulator [Archaeoglobales archaeon]
MIKVKEIKVVVRPLEEDFNEIAEAFRRIERGEELGELGGEKIVVESLDVLRKVLTPERLRILHTIKEKQPESIYELAKLLGRDRSSVVKDLEYLKLLGFVEFEEVRDKRDKKRPIVAYDEIKISIPV